MHSSPQIRSHKALFLLGNFIPFKFHSKIEKVISPPTSNASTPPSCCNHTSNSKAAKLRQQTVEIEDNHSKITLLHGISGVGKSISVASIFSRIAQFQSTSPTQNREIATYQITWIHINTPFDGSVKALCLNLISTFDRLLNTNYKGFFSAKIKNHTKLSDFCQSLISIHKTKYLVIENAENLELCDTTHFGHFINLIHKIDEYSDCRVILISAHNADGTGELLRRLSKTDLIYNDIHLKPFHHPKCTEWICLSRSLFPSEEVEPFDNDKTPNALYFASHGIIGVAAQISYLAHSRAISTGINRVDSDIIESVAQDSFQHINTSLQSLDFKQTKEGRTRQPYTTPRTTKSSSILTSSYRRHNPKGASPASPLQSFATPIYRMPANSLVAWFPEPLPDELCYSIISRAYNAFGRPTSSTFNKLFLGKRDKLPPTLIPDYLSNLLSVLPTPSSLTFDKLIQHHSLHRYLIDFSGMHSISRQTLYADRLYSCPECEMEDMNTYKTTYWHRIHQIRNIHICPKHHTLLLSTKVTLHSEQGIKRNYLIPLDANFENLNKPVNIRPYIRFANRVIQILEDKIPNRDKRIKILKSNLAAQGFLKKSGALDSNRLIDAGIRRLGESFVTLFRVSPTESGAYHLKKSSEEWIAPSETLLLFYEILNIDIFGNPIPENNSSKSHTNEDEFLVLRDSFRSAYLSHINDPLLSESENRLRLRSAQAWLRKNDGIWLRKVIRRSRHHH